MKNTMPSSVSTVATSSASPSLGRRLTALLLALTLTAQTLPAFAGVYYIHSDHLNTPRAVTNPQNQVIWQNPPLTEPFGSGAPDEDPDNDGQTFTLNLRFPGQYFDQETNSNYNYYRDHYFPGLGRYGQSDPIGLSGGINTYSYVNGNPLIYVDPEGKEAVAGCIAAIVIVSGAVIYIYCTEKSAELCQKMHPDNKNPLSPDRNKMHSQCIPKVPTLCKIIPLITSPITSLLTEIPSLPGQIRERGSQGNNQENSDRGLSQEDAAMLEGYMNQ